MSDFTISSDFTVDRQSAAMNMEPTMRFLKSVKGVEDAGFNGKNLYVEYYQQLVSERKIREIIEEMGVHLEGAKEEVPVKRERNPFKRYINKLAESNQKKFGNQRLDCCDLHKSKN